MTAKEHEIRELTRVATELIERLDNLTGGTYDQIVNLTVTAKRNRRMIWILSVGFVIEVLLTVAVAFGFFAISNAQDEIRDVRTVDRRDALCPLYQQFINADTPEGKERARTAGQDMKAREHAFTIIRGGYSALDCEQFDK